ncbi:MAG: hypothetical protein ACLQFR_21180 [Streptosporangiaceae bacterium]
MSQAADELLTPAGEQLLELLAGYDVTPGASLRLNAHLRGHYPPGLVAAAPTQQSLRMAAREKFGRAAEMLFTRAGLEQASSEVTAAHMHAGSRGCPRSPTCAAASAGTSPPWPQPPVVSLQWMVTWQRCGTPAGTQPS